MQLNVSDIARALGVTEKAVYRLIRAGDLPATRVGDQYSINRTVLLEWATSRGKVVSRDLFVGDDEAAAMPSLSDALERGGIFHGVQAGDKQAALRAVVDHMTFPSESDREMFLQVLVAREELGSTGVGNGIAIPHVRNPVVLHVPEPTVTLCFLDVPIDFGAVDGQPVHALFTMVSPTVRMHLHLISRLAFALREPQFASAVERKATAADLLSELRRVESGLMR
jgi:nitrogen PTS system EIIA component